MRNPLSRFFRRLFRGLHMPLYANVFGTSHKDVQGALAQSRVGDCLQIVRANGKAFVYNIELNRIVGYVDREIDKDLLFVFGNEFCLDGEISDIYGGRDGSLFSCRVKIYDTCTFMRDRLSDIRYLYENSVSANENEARNKC